MYQVIWPCPNPSIHICNGSEFSDDCSQLTLLPYLLSDYRAAFRKSLSFQTGGIRVLRQWRRRVSDKPVFKSSLRWSNWAPMWRWPRCGRQRCRNSRCGGVPAGGGRGDKMAKDAEGMGVVGGIDKRRGACTAKSKDKNITLQAWMPSHARPPCSAPCWHIVILRSSLLARDHSDPMRTSTSYLHTPGKRPRRSA